MTQFYLDPAREHEPHALPDGEVFFVSSVQFMTANPSTWMNDAIENNYNDNLTAAKHLEGYYWWTCFPGCMPDGEPSGPFDTEQEAIGDAQDF